MASLEEVAFLSQPVLKGIDWNALAAKGVNEHGVARNTVYASDYYYDYMRPAGIKAGKVRDTLNLDITAEQAYEQFKSLYDAVKAVKNLAYEAAASRISFLDDDNAMKMGTETLRSAVAICWFTALYSAELHRTGALVLSGKMTEEEIVRHASLTTAMFECISLLDGWNLLAPIKKNAPATAGVSFTSGVGALPVVAVALIVIGAVIAIAIIAFMVIGIMDVSQKNQMMKDECEKARESGDLDMYQSCLDALRSPSENIATTVFRDAVESFAPWIVGGGLVLIVITFWPFFARQLGGGHHDDDFIIVRGGGHGRRHH